MPVFSFPFLQFSLSEFLQMFFLPLSYVCVVYSSTPTQNGGFFPLSFVCLRTGAGIRSTNSFFASAAGGSAISLDLRTGGGGGSGSGRILFL
jgi:hypothetical protein